MVLLRGPNIKMRHVTTDDAVVFLQLYKQNREFLRPWEPARSPHFFTLNGQYQMIKKFVSDRRRGTQEVFAILQADEIVGKVALFNITRKSFLNGTLGYMVAEHANGRGIATEAVRLAVDYAFRALKLHRVQAATLLRNVRSQRVLEKVGFRHEGQALRYLRINGAWEDHYLFAITAEEWASSRTAVS